MYNDEKSENYVCTLYRFIYYIYLYINFSISFGEVMLQHYTAPFINTTILTRLFAVIFDFYTKRSVNIRIINLKLRIKICSTDKKYTLFDFWDYFEHRNTKYRTCRGL